jgi:hypothetical protein
LSRFGVLHYRVLERAQLVRDRVAILAALVDSAINAGADRLDIDHRPARAAAAITESSSPALAPGGFPASHACRLQARPPPGRGGPAAAAKRALRVMTHVLPVYRGICTLLRYHDTPLPTLRVSQTPLTSVEMMMLQE